MKLGKRWSVFPAAVLSLILSAAALGQGSGGSGGGGQKGRPDRVVVTPGEVLTRPGEPVTFTATLFDSAGNPLEGTFTWSMECQGIGSINPTGFFVPTGTGQGYVKASSGAVSGKALVTVADGNQYESLRARNSWSNRLRLMVMPTDTLLLPGQTVQLRAFLVDSNGVRTQTQADWRVDGNGQGSVNENGQFTANRKGIEMVQAVQERFTARARVMVAQSAGDTTGGDSIRVRFMTRDGRMTGETKRLREKGVLKMSGLAFPMDGLNGGDIAFPPGCVSGNIAIDVTLPENAEIGPDSVMFPRGILNGASFSVSVDGQTMEPFPFNTPVQLSLPLQAGQLEKSGLSPDQVGVFYCTTAGLDTTGLTNVVVDTGANRVYCQAAHFSTIVIAEKGTVVSAVGNHPSIQPEKAFLHANYPNPFNPETTIRFDLAGSLSRKAEVSVYDVLGRRIRVLFEGDCAPGSHTLRWDGTDDQGRSAGSGMYLVRLETQDFSQSRRMVLLK
ncbi:MAG: FlgD immunoglobulin-like domain containing protein [bacterium]|nr:FlgD immunoglobulin-like domain containing protein [bacterium]